MFGCPNVEFFSPYRQSETLFCISVRLLSFLLLLCTVMKSLSLFSWKQLKGIGRPATNPATNLAKSHLIYRLSKPCSLSLFSYRSPWPSLQSSVEFTAVNLCISLYWGPKTECNSMWSRKCWIDRCSCSSHLLMMLLLVQPRVLFLGHTAGSCSAHHLPIPSGPFQQSCFAAWQSPPVSLQGIVPSLAQDLVSC